MTTFDKREEGFEKQFAHDEELRFKANARRNKLLGLWAAEKLGLTGADAEAYAKEVVMADFEEAGDDDVFRKIRKDFDAKGVAQSDQQIRTTMDELMAQAVAQIKAGQIAELVSLSRRRAIFSWIQPMANLPGYSLARRLAAGETVYTGWCALPAPIVAEIDRPRRLRRRHPRPAARAVGHRRDRDRHRGDPRRRRGAGRARAARRIRRREPRARLRRRRHHRADDQHASPTPRRSSAPPSSRRSANEAGARRGR